MQLLAISFSFLVTARSDASAGLTVTPNTDRVERFGTYELTIRHEDPAYDNPWEDVDLSAEFRGPDERVLVMPGFYYDTDVWKVRFAPPTVGPWTGSLTLRTPAATLTETVSFFCEPSERRGFLCRHPKNPYRLVFEDGSLFNGIGIGDCVRDFNETGTPLDCWGFDGHFRDRETGAPHHGWTVDMETYMTAYGATGAGFNLFRWSIDNCAFKLWDTISTEGNRYLVQEGKWGDELVESLREHGFRVWLTFFGFHPAYPDAAEDPAKQEAVKRYLRYVVARHGAWADVWELMNEAEVPDEWITFAARYVRSTDPYDRLITTSWERPHHPDIDINAPHWYEKESEFESDVVTSRKITEAKRSGKPVVFGEQGNSGQNWDERSGLRMRIRSWTAFFEEGVLVFWNSSFAKDYKSGAANVYIGPEERTFIRALQDFTSRVDSEVERFSLRLDGKGVRGYGLRSGRMVLGYLHHFSDHENAVSATIRLELPGQGAVTWIDPASGKVLRASDVDAGEAVLKTAEFSVDLALRIDLAGAR